MENSLAMIILICLLAGIGAGVSTGFAGLSAATFISPMLVTFLGVDSFTAIGIALASDVLASAFSSATYIRHKNIQIKNCIPLFVSVLVFAVGGTVASYFLTVTSSGETFMNYWTIVVSLLLGVYFLANPMRRDYTRENRFTHHPVPSVICGAAIGFICGFQGTGGGLLMLVVLSLVLGYSLKSAVGTSVFIMTFTALIGAVSHFSMRTFSFDRQSWICLIICVVVTLAAAQISAPIANRIRTARCSLVIGILLNVAGIGMLAVKLAQGMNSLTPGAYITLWVLLGVVFVGVLLLLVRAVKITNTSYDSRVVENTLVHRLTWIIARHVIRHRLRKQYDFKTQNVPKIKGGYLMVANYTTRSDPYMAGAAARRQIYFVASESLTRMPRYQSMDFLFGPITMYNSDRDVKAVHEILRRLRLGRRVCVFPEKNRSYDGETRKINDNLGRLCKSSGKTLVTYRISGGYFCNPGWAETKRKGPVEGEVVGVYSPEEIQNMTADEVTAVINRDISVNAYEWQKERMYTYTGKDLAKGIERYLFICPRCGSYDAIESEGDSFRCTRCGAKAKFNDKGFIEGDFGYDTVYDWSRWLKRKFRKDTEEKDVSEPLIELDGVMEYEIEKNHAPFVLAAGTLRVYKDRVSYSPKCDPGRRDMFPEAEYAFSEMKGMSVASEGRAFTFTTEGRRHMGFYSSDLRALKCKWLYDADKKRRESPAAIPDGESRP
ncbi:MAG: TSUP family transporter [Clostridia bacterium]|nr:TSUP family transporter [Clostridia bacterium]